MKPRSWNQEQVIFLRPATNEYHSKFQEAPLKDRNIEVNECVTEYFKNLRKNYAKSNLCIKIFVFSVIKGEVLVDSIWRNWIKGLWNVSGNESLKLLYNEIMPCANILENRFFLKFAIFRERLVKSCNIIEFHEH